MSEFYQPIMKTLDEAYAWLRNVPERLTVEIWRTNRTGENEVGAKNFIGVRSVRTADWVCRIKFEDPSYNNEGGLNEFATGVVFADGETLLEAIDYARWLFERADHSYWKEHQDDWRLSLNAFRQQQKKDRPG